MCEADYTSDGAVGEEFVVGAEGSVCDGPLTAWVDAGFVMSPVVRIRGVVHADFEVLRAGEEEVAIVGELAGVAAAVVVDDCVGV